MTTARVKVPLAGIGFGEESEFLLKISEYPEMRLKGGLVHQIELPAGHYDVSVRESFVSSEPIQIKLEADKEYTLNLVFGDKYLFLLRTIFNPKSSIRLRISEI